jgi:tRNA U54 and U55 pseudouridine synthase Pus10
MKFGELGEASVEQDGAAPAKHQASTGHDSSAPSASKPDAFDADASVAERSGDPAPVDTDRRPSESREPRRERRGGREGGGRSKGSRNDRGGKPPGAKLFLEGRYLKHSRDLPQTVFFCPECKGHPRRRKGCERCEGFGKLTKDSVQELVAWVVGKAFGTRKNKFHGAGREDVDVRMLGRGRPFVLELADPKVFDLDLAELEAEVNRRNEGRLEIQGLHYSEKQRVAELKETHHAKEYGALVELGEPVEIGAFERLQGERHAIVQKTPERVAHRRADKDRERWIEFLSVEPRSEDGRQYHVTLRTQHGTYVKEVLSGEDGATRPSLTEWLGVPARCTALDVLAILDSDGAPEVVHARPPAFGAGLD